ncbi:hypothetical protein [Burkholderia sp. MBR-1]|uniref:hypothetical protein n=1 Tax=Burkholderia sp. MBR-1 TaxID=2732364 RepID=UPI0015EF5A5F|nr:hypothetical protein [Burkholderia sp. MBR-1]QMI49712.1 hypothetical protein MBR110_30000 [Burkholderia sp. MBR-1]
MKRIATALARVGLGFYLGLLLTFIGYRGLKEVDGLPHFDAFEPLIPYDILFPVVIGVGVVLVLRGLLRGMG